MLYNKTMIGDKMSKNIRILKVDEEVMNIFMDICKCAFQLVDELEETIESDLDRPDGLTISCDLDHSMLKMKVALSSLTRKAEKELEEQLLNCTNAAEA